ncbi:MAG TPA: YceI family protein [Acidimicrobiales bacterium]
MRFAIVPERSRVWIEARSSLHPIHSTTSGLEGWLDMEVAGGRVDPSGTTQGRLELAVDLLSSGNPINDREMKRRIDARRYPTITGELTGIEDIDDGDYRVRGDLTFRGVTQSYEGRMEIVLLDDGSLSLEGERVFDIREFGMQPPKILMLRVYPEVSVRVSIVAEKRG